VIYEVNNLQFDSDRLDSICSKYGVAVLKIFGSFAKNMQTSNSDVDILYSFKEGMNPGIEIVAFAEALEELFDRTVDIVPLKYLKDHQLNMLEESIPLYDAA
jgi:predicted nucleotidyltransferase